ncbi:AhpC/TSA family protein [Neobacillus niacini]|uniref:AhpC/TSA family protein n=1 Tax=Neobacillus niacini TaxID=86668 RepID=UPI001EE73704|nr:AhpC/TSA family protein [Neobacillus niacini]
MQFSQSNHLCLTVTGCQIVIITPSTGGYLGQFVEAFGHYPYSVYGDPKRELYYNMGHQTMQKWKLLAKAGKGLLKGGTKAFIPDDPEQKKARSKSHENT